MNNQFFFFSFLLCWLSQAQVFEFQTSEKGQSLTHRILMDEEYIIETIYQENPPLFILTRGGFYQKEAGQISAKLEFNSLYAKDSMKTFQWDPTAWKAKEAIAQILDGKWLMAGRVKPEGEQRRDITRSRKTMKFLRDGCFQWTAFNTQTFQFFGSGGGSYTADKGNYVEQIGYFSRDNSRVGARLSFEYDRKANDWYHKGLSSKGKPLHEIWTERPKE